MLVTSVSLAAIAELPGPDDEYKFQHWSVVLFRLLSFQQRDTKLDRFLPKNQYTRRKLLYLVN